jgi:hypothetical protein
MRAQKDGRLGFAIAEPPQNVSNSYSQYSSQTSPLQPFDIRDHLDRLTLDGGTQTTGNPSYLCPVCGSSNFKVELKTGKHSTFGCDCAGTERGKKAIRDSIAPLTWVKPPRTKNQRSWNYFGADGTQLIRVERSDDGCGQRRFHQVSLIPGKKAAELTDRVMPYRYTDCLDAIARGEQVLWVEGESTADALWATGIAATTSIGGSGRYRSDQYRGLFPSESLVVCPDRDAAGIKYSSAIAVDYPDAQWLYAIPKSPLWYRLADGGGADLADWIAEGATKEVILAAIEPRRDLSPKASNAPSAPTNSPSDDRPVKRSIADQLLDLVEAASVELFSTSDGTAYADIQDGATRQTLGLRKSEFKDWLTHQYYSTTKKSASADAITQVISTLDAKARFQGEKRAVFIRSAALDGAVYLDLGDDSWGVVEISATGWRLVYDAPVRFRRPSGQLPLPTPIAGGDLNALQSLLNLDQDNWVIVLLWLLQSLKPAAEYPILVVMAPPRVGKTTSSETLKNTIDPSTVSMLPSVGDVRNFAVTCSNRRIVAIDNLSNLTPDQSDILCRAATGGGYSHRTLHSDSDETTIGFLNPQILNGIEAVATRGDLLDRSLQIVLSPPSERISRSTFKTKFAELHPAILGALLTLLSDVLRVMPEVAGQSGQSSERFTELVEIGLAVEKVLNWPIGTVDRVLKTARSEAHEIAVDSSPVGAAIRELMANPPDRAEWRGTAAQLLNTLSQIVPEKISRGKYWPADSTRLAKILTRIGSDLEAIGIPIKRQKSNGTIMLTLTKTIDAPTPPPNSPEPIAIEVQEEIQWKD